MSAVNTLKTGINLKSKGVIFPTHVVYAEKKEGSPRDIKFYCALMANSKLKVGDNFYVDYGTPEDCDLELYVVAKIEEVDDGRVLQKHNKSVSIDYYDE